MGSVCSELFPGFEMDQGPVEGFQERSAQWRKDLLQKVDKINTSKYPGKMVVFGRCAEPVFCRNDDITNTIIAAASFGKGRIVAFSADKITSDFMNDRNRSEPFHENITRWVTRCSKSMVDQVQVIDISKITDFKDVRKQLGDKPTVLAWTGTTARSEFFLDNLREWISDGGGFVCGLRSWVLAKGKTVQDIPIYGLLREAGILYTSSALKPKDNFVKVLDNIADQCHIQFLLDACKESEKGLKKHGIQLAHLLHLSEKELVEALSTDLKKVIRKYKPTIQCVPKPDAPVKTEEGRVLIFIQNALVYNGLTDEKIGPGCDVFPGIIIEKDINPTTKNIKMTSEPYEEFHFTGLYLPPGKEITVKVKEGVHESKYWKMFVGAHTDKMTIGYKKPLTRWPVLCIRRNLNTDEIKFVHPFGGLVFFSSPGEKDCVLDVEIQNVIQAPVFDIRKDNHQQVWKYTQDAPGLWAELSGELITFIIPRSTASAIDDPKPVMKRWDDAVRHIYYLRGRTEGRRQVIVFDQQPTIGELHSGYPIVAKLGGGILGKNGEIPGKFNIEHLKENIPWGVVHEMGHNMQSNLWTFEGTREVTCNIFSMYVTQMVTGEPAWEIIKKWDRQRLAKVYAHFKKAGATFENWKKNPWVGLVIYIQLARDFGWSSYNKIFRRYNNIPTKDKPKTNQEKIDMWMVAFSKIVRHNVSPLFEFWGLPLTDNATDSVLDLPAYLPDDMITKQYGQEQTAEILDKYPKLVRDPDSLPAPEGKVDEVFMRFGYGSDDESDKPDDDEDEARNSDCDNA